MLSHCQEFQDVHSSSETFLMADINAGCFLADSVPRFSDLEFPKYGSQWSFRSQVSNILLNTVLPFHLSQE